MAASSDANVPEALAAGVAQTSIKQPWKPPGWWGPFWAVVYALLLTPAALISAWLFFGYLGHLLDVEYWVPAQHTGSAYEIILLSPYCAGFLILLRFLPNHPLPTLKKIGFVTAFLIGAFWILIPTV